VTLSPQLSDFSRVWKDEDGIEFDVLLDLGLAVARDYGLTYQLPEVLQRLYTEGLKIDLARYNGDESWQLPIPATFVVDQAGSIVFASADPDYTVRPEPSDVVAAIPSS
jgi:peroxiredoxin